MGPTAPDDARRALERYDRTIELSPTGSWTLPSLARREGGLWCLSPSAIRQMRSAADREQLDRPYEETPFAPLYESPPTGLLDAQRPLAGALPTIDMGSEPAATGGVCGGPLPARAARLLGERMSVVLRRSQLLPAGALERWGRREFLSSQLAGMPCHVLIASAQTRKSFKYWTEEANMSDRVPAGYSFSRPVTSETMGVDRFFTRAASAARGECLYLQQSLLGNASAGGPAGQTNGQPGLGPVGNLGREMLADLSGALTSSTLASLVQTGRFGPPSRCQLFVGAASAAGARTALHFDQYDNVFVQIAGSKTFVLFDPYQSGHLYPYPVHHPLDRSAQAQLLAPDDQPSPTLMSISRTSCLLDPG